LMAHLRGRKWTWYGYNVVHRSWTTGQGAMYISLTYFEPSHLNPTRRRFTNLSLLSGQSPNDTIWYDLDEVVKNTSQIATCQHSITLVAPRGPKKSAFRDSRKRSAWRISLNGQLSYEERTIEGSARGDEVRRNEI
jgi:hypothetical protein